MKGKDKSNETKKDKIVSYDTNLLERYDMAEYAKLHEAFDFFNKELFKDSLPQVFFTVQRRNKTAGFFRPDSFKERKVNDKGEILAPGFSVHEIAMMPEVYEYHTDRQILSTIVHEMTHLQQQEFGNPGRKGYHNKEWSGFMKEVGLQPSSLGEYDCRNPEKPTESKSSEEGKETGQRVSHYIMANGPFDFACNRLLESGFKLSFHSIAPAKKKIKKSKFKFTCPECCANAWAKDGTKLACGNCEIPLDQEESDADSD